MIYLHGYTNACNMLFSILQVPAAVEKLAPDSLKTKAVETIGIIKETEPSVLLQNLGQQAIHFGLKVVAALAIYFIGGWIIGRIKKILNRGFKRRGTDPTLVSFINSALSISLWGLLIIIVIGTLGINTTSLAALLAGGGMALGMAMNGTVQNFAGGIMLIVFKPFKAGDFIEVQGHSGTVLELNMTSTKLRTTDNRIIVVPNGALSSGTINNISINPIRRIEWTIDVEYGSDYDTVKKVLRDIVSANDKVLDSTTEGAADPFIELMSFKDSGVQFVVRAWVNTPDYWDVTFRINEEIYKQLPANGISFPFPQLDVRLKDSNK